MSTEANTPMPDMAMPHLGQSTTQIKEEVEQAATLPEKGAPNLDDPKLKEEWTFQFKWLDPVGHVSAGTFTNKILSIAERQLSGAMRARLSGGVPFDSLDPLTDELNLILSHLAFSLTVKPKWAEDLRTVKYPALLQALYEEVASHEAVFLGFQTPTSKSKEGSDDGK